MTGGKWILHVHRADMPGRCFWACAEDGTLAEHAEYAHEFEGDLDTVRAVSDAMTLKYQTHLEIIVTKAFQPEALPDRMRALIWL